MGNNIIFYQLTCGLRGVLQEGLEGNFRLSNWYHDSTTEAIYTWVVAMVDQLLSDDHLTTAQK